MIVESGAQVKDGVKLVNDAGTALTDIVGSIKKVADIVSDIASASREQSAGVEEINKAVTQMDEMTQQNSALVRRKCLGDTHAAGTGRGHAWTHVRLPARRIRPGSPSRSC